MTSGKIEVGLIWDEAFLLLFGAFLLLLSFRSRCSFRLLSFMACFRSNALSLFVLFLSAFHLRRICEDLAIVPVDPSSIVNPKEGKRNDGLPFCTFPKGRQSSVPGPATEGPVRTAEPNEEEHIAQAARAFVRILNLNSESQIRDKITIRDYKPGENVTKQNDLEHVNHLYYIIWGECSLDWKET